MSEETEKQLRSLGYASGRGTGKLELTGDGADPKDRIHILELIDEANTKLKAIPAAQRLQSLEQALKEDPMNPLLYYYLGEAYEKSHRETDALKLYETAIARKVTDTGRIHVRMALLYGRMGRVDDGILAFEKAMDADPTDEETLNRLAVAYLLKGRQAEAERLLQAILVLNPESAQALNSLGWIALRKRDVATARQYFERSLKADPEFLEPYINLGMLSKQSGDFKNARSYFEAYLAKATSEKHREAAARIKKELALLPKASSSSVLVPGNSAFTNCLICQAAMSNSKFSALAEPNSPATLADSSGIATQLGPVSPLPRIRCALPCAAPNVRKSHPEDSAAQHWQGRIALACSA